LSFIFNGRDSTIETKNAVSNAVGVETNNIAANVAVAKKARLPSNVFFGLNQCFVLPIFLPTYPAAVSPIAKIKIDAYAMLISKNSNSIKQEKSQ